MLPKIIFRYSRIYDEQFKNKKISKKNYSIKKILSYMRSIELKWKKYEKKILVEKEKISGLNWKRKLIIVYLVSDCIPFSEPLTIHPYKNKDTFIDVLTHELIHNLFVDNLDSRKVKNAWNYFNKKYKKEDLTTRIHILLYAIHSHLYIKFFGKERLNKDIGFKINKKSYQKAWSIVLKEGYENILKEFKEKIKK